MNSQMSAFDSVGLAKSRVTPTEAKDAQPWSYGQLGNKSVKWHLSAQDVERYECVLGLPLSPTLWLLDFIYFLRNTNGLWETFEKAMTSLI